MSEPTTQMNVRIGTSLKQLGDSVFARQGLSASEVVRRIWEIAAEGKDQLSMLMDLLIHREAEERRQPLASDQALDADEGSQLYYRAVSQLPAGIVIGQAHATDDELFEQAFFERMVERGLA